MNGAEAAASSRSRFRSSWSSRHRVVNPALTSVVCQGRVDNLMPRDRRPRYVETDQLLLAVGRMLSAASSRVAGEDPEELRQLVELERVLAECIRRAVHGLRRNGVTWQEVGEVLGTSRQAAQQRWGGTAEPAGSRDL